MFITMVHNFHYTPQQVWETTWPEYLLMIVGFDEMEKSNEEAPDILESEDDVLSFFHT